MTIDKSFAKDVAKQLDKRQRRRRFLVLGTAATLIVLAVLYLRCGHGWGLRGGGAGSGSATTAGSAPAPRRCAVRVAADGISLDGKHVTQAEAVAACKDTAGAEVIVTGDAREGDWKQLEAAFEAAHIPITGRPSR